MNGCQILALAPNDWDGLWMNRQQLLSRLGESFPVLYSTGVRSTWDADFLSRGPGGLFGRFVSRGNVRVDRAAALILRIPRLSRLDDAVVRIAVRRWRRELGRYGSGPLVAYVFHPQYQEYLHRLRPDFVVFHAYDLYSRGPGWSADDEAAQRQLLNVADLIVATSRVIADELGAQARRHVHLVPNGVDYEAFSCPSADPEPADLAQIPHPRIGHVGRLNAKVDIQLIIELARRHPEWSFLLVGPIVDLTAEDQAAYEPCRRIPNIHLLGVKPRQDLPRYVRRLDVGMLAYRQGVLWTAGIYPLKLHEYLAGGLPVVSSDIPSVRDFPQVVRTAATLEEWSAAIAAACTDNRPERRRLRQDTARENSWDQRVRTLKGLIEGMLSRSRTDSSEKGGGAA